MTAPAPAPFAVLLVAAGRGARAGAGAPKQYRGLRGRPVLARAMAPFLAHPGCALAAVAIHPDDRAAYTAAAPVDPRLLPPVPGGATRAASVRAGLQALARAGAPDTVLIHDAARPFVTAEVIDRVAGAVAPGTAAFPALPIVDTLWRAEAGVVSGAQAREGLWRAQTPQGFVLSEILAAHGMAGQDATDDVAIAHDAGHSVRVVMGDGNNFKITLAEDFARAERLLGSLSMDVRTGNGFDVHAFGPGDAVTLCGVRVPFDRALSGHSDADVGLHALTDAVFGALGEGDIGTWFPPSEPEWKGASSDRFLARAAARAGERGFALAHLDCTLICEAPRIGPHAATMRARVAVIAGIDPDRVSVKATTSEGLGFTGRGEGIAAIATATLVAR